ncbi:hypothetical protein RGR602_PB00434 (plasmid) [Rhizobium gallicum bv. gallicum R602sp]|uniref:Uncharacterized protein n=1 Tax=Rhizobium gallicum bv. gallicum R602sp TaxID=1041138 RepID=A0A0B4X7J6_9HYPH|nr:hypothetical protein RGR602_PB00434 [Rhizobium gallicum bv. gallicum R602sp]
MRSRTLTSVSVASCLAIRTSTITQRQLVDLAHQPNSLPGRCSGYKTPAEVFIAHLRECDPLPCITGMMHLAEILQKKPRQAASMPSGATMLVFLRLSRTKCSFSA